MPVRTDMESHSGKEWIIMTRDKTLLRLRPALLILLAVLLAAAVLAPAASAQTIEDDLPRPVLPDGIPEEIMPPVPDQQSDMGIILGEEDSLLISEATVSAQDNGAPGELVISVQEREPLGSVTRTWDATVEGGTEPYSYQFYMVLPTYIDGKWIYYAQGQQPYSKNSSYSFTFQYDGEYQLWVDVRDGGGRATRCVQNVSIEGLGVQPLRIIISEPMGDFFTDVTAWNIDFTGGDGYYKHSIELVDIDMDVRATQQDGSIALRSSVLSYRRINDYSTDGETSYSYQFLASGHYELRVWVTDGSNRTVYAQKRFSAYDERYPTIYEKATEIVSQCRAEGITGEYETAVWLHDWLTEHADYDQSYGHYHADGVMCGGTGVCDSYAKAYLLLLNEAGIPADRITNVEHAWNAVQLGGEWYYADVTWDDAGNGLEHHLYCFIPEEIISIDHPAFYDADHVCNNYLYNYYVQDGEAQVWADSLAEGISAALQEGDYSFSVPFPESYTFEGKVTRSSRLSAPPVLADELSMLLASERQYVYQETGETVPLSFVPVTGKYDGSGKYLFAGHLGCEADFPMVSLPANLETVGEQAFQGDSGINYVIIAEGTGSIGSGAFADCGGLWMVLIPRSVTSIAADAFDQNNKHLTLCVEAGSDAEQYAIDKGIRYRVTS